MDAQLPLPTLYGESNGTSVVLCSGAVTAVLCIDEVPDTRRGLGERKPADGSGWLNWPIGCCPEEDFGRGIDWWLSELRWPQGSGDGSETLSLPFSPGAEMVGATSDDRSPKAALLRLEVGMLPVCWVYSAFFFAIAAAASGNIALIVDGSRPELRLFPGDGGGRPRELRDPSTLSLLIASLRRLDMASVEY